MSGKLDSVEEKKRTFDTDNSSTTSSFHAFSLSLTPSLARAVTITVALALTVAVVIVETARRVRHRVSKVTTLVLGEEGRGRSV